MELPKSQKRRIFWTRMRLRIVSRAKLPRATQTSKSPTTWLIRRVRISAFQRSISIWIARSKTPKAPRNWRTTNLSRKLARTAISAKTWPISPPSLYRITWTCRLWIQTARRNWHRLCHPEASTFNVTSTWKRNQYCVRCRNVRSDIVSTVGSGLWTIRDIFVHPKTRQESLVYRFIKEVDGNWNTVDIQRTNWNDESVGQYDVSTLRPYVRRQLNKLILWGWKFVMTLLKLSI